MARIDSIPKSFDPAEAELPMYDGWVSAGYFHPRPDPAKKPFTIVMPPPNITGQLHMGHALNNTLQDILIRSKRMQGYAALWIPGADHASIATEAKIVGISSGLIVRKSNTSADIPSAANCSAEAKATCVEALLAINVT